MSDQLRDNRRNKFYIIDNDFLDRFGSELGPYGIAVYNAIARFANKEGENSFPSYPKIAELTGMGRTKAVESVNRLVTMGLILREQRRTQNGQATNVYTLIDVADVSSPRELTSVRHVNSPPFATRTHPRSPREPDQDTLIKTPLSRRVSSGGERAIAAPQPTQTPPPAPPKTPATSKPLRLPNDGYEMPATDNTPPVTEPTSKQLQRWAPQVEPRKFANGYIPAGTGDTPVEVWYESFSVTEVQTRLTAPDQDDLRSCGDLARLREIVTTYRQCDFKRKRNIRLILDWYRDGIPDTYRRPAQSVNGAAPPATVLNFNWEDV